MEIIYNIVKTLYISPFIKKNRVIFVSIKELSEKVVLQRKIEVIWMMIMIIIVIVIGNCILLQ